MVDAHGVLHSWVGLPERSRVPYIRENQRNRALRCSIVRDAKTGDTALNSSRNILCVVEVVGLGRGFDEAPAHLWLLALEQVSDVENLKKVGMELMTSVHKKARTSGLANPP